MPWISKVKKSNLTQFIDGNYIQSPSDYFASSKQNIKKLIQAQTVHEQRALQCIIEIGKTLSDLYDYKKRSHSPRIDKMWNDLVAEFQYSPATVTKYIKISKNPVLADERFKNRIPSSVYSLYELSKIEPIALQLLIESNEITSASGRTDVVALTAPTKLNKQSKMSLAIDKKNWITSYKSFEDDLIEFLNSKDISYSLSSQVKSLEKSEVARFKKIEKYVFQQSKAHFNKVVKDYIESQCRTKNLCPPKTQFKKKIKLLKFGVDEVTTEGCITTREIEERFLALGLQEESIWNGLQISWATDAFEKYPSKIPESIDTTNPAQLEDLRKQYESRNFTPVKKKYDFTGFKV